jgi:disulfide bond formation protein DsbB
VKPLTEPVVQIVSAFALVGQAFLLVMVLLAFTGLFFGPSRRAFDWLRVGLRGSELWIAFVVALLATGGSLFFSEYSNFIPCKLCWYQRYAMYPLVPILLLAALLKHRLIAWFALAVAVVGAGIATWHRYVEINPSLESQGCKASGGGGCATDWLSGLAPLDYITIPTLTLTAFGLIIFFLLLALFPPKTGAGQQG